MPLEPALDRPTSPTDIPSDTDSRRITAAATAAGLEQLGIACDARQLEQLLRYRDILLSWNAERMNLTRITAPLEIASEHFLDSASLLAVFDVPDASHLLDIGAGAGFPALPIAILRPDLNVTLLEATAKKLAFCEAAAQHIGLNRHRLSFYHGRAEEPATRRKLGASFDLVTARAVAPLIKLAPWCVPYLKPHGVFAAWKGALAADEARDAEAPLRLIGVTSEVLPVTVPGSDRAHAIVLCRRN